MPQLRFILAAKLPRERVNNEMTRVHGGGHTGRREIPLDGMTYLIVIRAGYLKLQGKYTLHFEGIFVRTGTCCPRLNYPTVL